MKHFICIGAVATLAFLIAPSTLSAALTYKGMSYLSFNAPADFDNPQSDGALMRIEQINANTVALNVWDFTPSTTSTTIAADYNRYSSTTASITHAIQEIHSLGMNVMLKPMVDVNNGTWRGQINPAAAQVNNWFNSYDSFINSMASIAQTNYQPGDLLSLGCELNNMEQYTSNWTSLISTVRTEFSGKLTYSANWAGNNLGHGGYNNISWWNALDYIGIDAYFPLTNINNPTETQLQSSWQSIAANINSWRTGQGLTQNVIFTEAGYQAADGTNMSPAGVSGSPMQDIQEQADCYQALLSTMSAQSWWDGIFWWAWDPTTPSLTDSDFSPENKPATDAVLEEYYVPEPSSLSLALIGGTLLLRRMRPSL